MTSPATAEHHQHGEPAPPAKRAGSGPLSRLRFRSAWANRNGAVRLLRRMRGVRLEVQARHPLCRRTGHEILAAALVTGRARAEVRDRRGLGNDARRWFRERSSADRSCAEACPQAGLDGSPRGETPRDKAAEFWVPDLSFPGLRPEASKCRPKTGQLQLGSCCFAHCWRGAERVTGSAGASKGSPSNAHGRLGTAAWPC